MVKLKCFKTLIINFLLVIFSLQVNAKKVDSYIITNNHDTIYGKIRLSRFNLFHNTISLNSYHMEELYDHLFFKSQNDKRFKELLPKDIVEYGFILDRRKFRYISKDVEPTWGKNKRRFYLQIADGAINVFQISTFIDNRGKNLNPYGTRVSEYYILTKNGHLLSLFENDRGESVSAFLTKNLDLDKETLDRITKGKTFKDIWEIALLYNQQVSLQKKR